jgi:hypothetical protein
LEFNLREEELENRIKKLKRQVEEEKEKNLAFLQNNQNNFNGSVVSARLSSQIKRGNSLVIKNELSQEKKTHE